MFIKSLHFMACLLPFPAKFEPRDCKPRPNSRGRRAPSGRARSPGAQRKTCAAPAVPGKAFAPAGGDSLSVRPEGRLDLNAAIP
jgi:hypothetical protein